MDLNYSVPVGKAVRAVLSGLAMALLTPNRVGEFAARVLVLPTKYRAEAIWLGSIGGLAQIVVTFFLGLVGGSLMLTTTEKVNLSVLESNFSILLIGITLGIITLFAFFYLHSIIDWLSSLRWFSNWQGRYHVLRNIKPLDNWIILLISTIKYCVYLSQYYLVMIFCGIPLTLIQGIMAISVIYLTLTFIPVAALADIGIRGSVSLMVISLYADLPVNILAASLFIWLINIALPSIIGLLLMIKIKF